MISPNIAISHFLVAARLFFLGLLLMFLVAACSSESPPTVVPAVPANDPRFSIIPVSTDLAVGVNRLTVGLVDNEKNTPITDAKLHFRLFKLEPAAQGHREILKAEMDARPVTIQRNYTHVHPDGALETHGAGEIGIYAVDVDFDSSGEWGVEITGTADAQSVPTLTLAFDVRERSFSVPIGEAAPRTVQLILSDVEDIFDIDTSNPPSPHMHDMTIADAVTSGKPTVIVFSTPGFCQSRVCGPVKDGVDELYGKHKEQANFIHVEPFDLGKLRNNQEIAVVPSMVEWGLQAEPWVFLVDSDGNIAAKFEGIVSFDELEAALQKIH